MKLLSKTQLKLALTEDLYPYGDITSSLLKKSKIIEAKLVSNQKAVVAGLLFAKHTFNQVDKKIKFLLKKKRWIPSQKKFSNSNYKR